MRHQCTELAQWCVVLLAPLLISGSYVGPQFEKDSVKMSGIQGLLLNYRTLCLAAPQTSSLHFWAAAAPALTSYQQPTAY